MKSGKLSCHSHGKRTSFPSAEEVWLYLCFKKYSFPKKNKSIFLKKYSKENGQCMLKKKTTKKKSPCLTGAALKMGKRVTGVIIPIIWDTAAYVAVPVITI